MSTCFLLIPGGRIPASALANLSRQTLALLQKIAPASYEVKKQVLQSRQKRAMAHHSWLWRVIGKESFATPLGALEWQGIGAPRLSDPMARLHILTLNYQKAPYTEQRLAPLMDILRRHLESLHYRLQVWDNHYYLSRKKPWEITATVWTPRIHHKEDFAFFASEDRDFVRIFNELQDLVHAWGQRQQRPLTLWVDGFSPKPTRVRPCTYRLVQTDDPIVRGMAESVGLRPNMVISSRQTMPPTPPGDIIVVFEDFLPAYFQKDWKAWEEVVPKLLERFTLLQQEKGRIREIVPIYFGTQEAVTLLPIQGGFLSIFQKKQTTPVVQWLGED